MKRIHSVTGKHSVFFLGAIFALGAVVLSGFSQYSDISFNNQQENTTQNITLLNPVDFSLPATAKEIPEKRTETSATFEISPGKFAAVSFGGQPNVSSAVIHDECASRIPLLCSTKTLLHGLIPSVFATTAGPNSPGTIVDDDSVGTVTWSNPENAGVSDNVYATVSASNTFSDGSHYIKATNFGFSIPSGATINGVMAEFERKCSGSTSFINCSGDETRLIKGGILSGDVKYGATWPTTDAYATFGDASDLWSLSLTSDDINATNFGVVLGVYLTARASF